MKYSLLIITALLLDTIGSCRPTDPDFLEVEPNEVMLDSRGGSATIEVKSNTQWNIAVSESWLGVFPSSGNNDGVIRVTVLPNEATRNRSCTLFVTGGAMHSEVHVYQKGKAIADD